MEELSKKQLVEYRLLLSDENKLNYENLTMVSSNMPKKITNYKDFLELVKHSHPKTPIGRVKISPHYAFSHLTNNSRNVNRYKYTGAFTDILTNPLLIVRKDYFHEKRNKHIEEYVFYKPYLLDGKIHNMLSIVSAEKGDLFQVTFFKSLNDCSIKKLIKCDEEDLVYSNPKIESNLLKTVIPKDTRGAICEIIQKAEDNVKDFDELSEKSLTSLLLDFEKSQGNELVDKNSDEIKDKLKKLRH